LENVLNIVEEYSLPLWPSDVGYVTSKAGYLYTGVHDEALRNALREAGAPVVYVPQRLRDRAEDIFKGRVLRPHRLCHFLRR
jgi:sacsin